MRDCACGKVASLALVCPIDHIAIVESRRRIDWEHLPDIMIHRDPTSFAEVSGRARCAKLHHLLLLIHQTGLPGRNVLSVQMARWVLYSLQYGRSRHPHRASITYESRNPVPKEARYDPRLTTETLRRYPISHFSVGLDDIADSPPAPAHPHRKRL